MVLNNTPSLVVVGSGIQRPPLQKISILHSLWHLDLNPNLLIAWQHH